MCQESLQSNKSVHVTRHIKNKNFSNVHHRKCIHSLCPLIIIALNIMLCYSFQSKNFELMTVATVNLKCDVFFSSFETMILVLDANLNLEFSVFFHFNFYHCTIAMCRANYGSYYQ